MPDTVYRLCCLTDASACADWTMALISVRYLSRPEGNFTPSKPPAAALLARAPVLVAVSAPIATTRTDESACCRSQSVRL